MADERLSKERIKSILTNVISKNAEKAVSQANYDRTILATVQYCIDSSIGQYKIKYQDGYYTAYSNGSENFGYSPGAAVFVKIPENDFTKRLFITGSATNSNDDRVYLVNMDAGQQYKTKGPNILKKGAHGDSDDLNLSSYWCSSQYETEDPQEYVKKYYKKDGESSNILAVTNTGIDSLRQYNYFKFSVSFKTNLFESRKNSGDYGVRLVLRYKLPDKKEVTYKTYEINTFTMSGAPFEFNDYVTQYAYWELEDATYFDGIQEISGFVRNFPIVTQSSSEWEYAEDKDYRDIFVKDVGIYPAIKLYESSNDMYKVNIYSDDSWFHFSSEANSTIKCSAQFFVQGEEVKYDNGQELKFYWAKQDSTVDSPNNGRWCDAFGKGYYCLNKCSTKTSTASTMEELAEDSVNEIGPTQTINVSSDKVEWNTKAKDIVLPKSLFKGKVNKIQCAVEYGGQIYKSELQPIYNDQGLYVLIGSQDNQTSKYNGLGYFTIAAGVFRDSGIPSDPPDNSMTLASGIEYTWTEQKAEMNEPRDLPLKSAVDILTPYNTWDSSRDNETKNDTEVAQYLGSNEELALCQERYTYYSDKYDVYYKVPRDQQSAYSNPDYNTRIARCKKRKDNIIKQKQQYILKKFKSTYENKPGYYILGTSDVEGVYEQDHTYLSARVKRITCHDTWTGSPDTVRNTLYKLPVNNISTNATYTVSVTQYNPSTGKKDYIGSASITLVNEEGATLDYSLQIMNGEQSYMYTEAGFAPTSKLVNQPIAIQPLYFVLTNKSGEKIYDSSDPQSYDIDLQDLHPIWKFYDPSCSFISTEYTGDNTDAQHAPPAHRDQTDTDLWLYENAAQFYYTLAEKYSPYYRNKSNVELQVSYDGQSIFSTTSFTFAKQGELGTNGTDRMLSIQSDTYNKYKQDVLVQDQYSWIKPFNTQDTSQKKKEHITPDQRYVGNPYLFATDCFSSSDTSSYGVSIREGKYVNLGIAQTSITTPEIVEQGMGLNQNMSATYQVAWHPTDNDSTLDDAKWTIEEMDKVIPVKNANGSTTRYYFEPVVSVTSPGASTTVRIKNQFVQDPVLSYRPSPIDNFIKDGETCKRIGNSMIQVEASRAIPNQNGATRKNYAFCNIPYFYFNWNYNVPNAGRMPEGVDPARHIILTGGFDQVMYDSAGQHPQYNNMTPFQFYMKDRDGNDITNEVLQAALHGNATIQWECSKGLIKKNVDSTKLRNLPDYPDDFPPDKDLLGKLCKYNGVNYRCIKSHVKNVAHKVGGQTYAANSFVYPYWEQIDASIYMQSVTFEPADTFSTVVKNDLFYSWIHLYVQYDHYEAEVFLPINIYCNVYEDPTMNNWNGKSLLMLDEDENGQSRVIANKVSAGIKDDQNEFLGISIGENIRFNERNEIVSSIGLFGYGYKRKLQSGQSPPKAYQTLFLDAESGLAAFGPVGSTQVILDPSPNNWSRLGGWYFSKNFLYKPVNERDDQGREVKTVNYRDLELGRSIQPGNPTGDEDNGPKTFGIYAPGDTIVDNQTVAIWAGTTDAISGPTANPGSFDKVTRRGHGYTKNAEFKLTYGGDLYASSVTIAGNITAKGGSFTNDVASIEINTRHNGRDYILYNPAFGVYTSGNSSQANLFVKGDIEAHSGIIGTGADLTDVNTMYLMREYFPWVLPGDNEAWNDSTYHLDPSAGTTTDYILYHKNFSIDTDGVVRIDGNIFARSGRLGGWVVTKVLSDPTNPQSDPIDCLKAYTNNVILRSDGYATFGKLKINPNGSISGDKWSISDEGEASFENTKNVYYGSSITIGNSVWGQGGLHLDAGETLEIGNNAGLTAVTDSGFTFTGGGCRFDVDSVMLGGEKDTNLSLMAGAKITLTDGLTLDDQGIHMSYGGGGYGINNDGTASFKSISVGGDTYKFVNNGDLIANDITANNLTLASGATIMIGNLTLEDYIISIANTKLAVNYTTKNVRNAAGTDKTSAVDWIGNLIRK